MKYYVRSVKGHWEEISEYVFKNRKFAVIGESPRYTEDAIQQNGTEITFSGTVTLDEMGKIFRFLGGQQPSASYLPILQEPDAVEIKKGRSHILHMIETGKNWVQKAA